MNQDKGSTKARRYLILTLVTICVAGCLPSKAERSGKKIVSEITQKLNMSSEPVAVADVWHGSWSFVCMHPPMSSGGTLTKQFLEKKFEVSDLFLPNGMASSSDWNWIMMFFYPPNTLEILSIETKDLYSYGVQSESHNEQYPMCRSKKDAALYLKVSAPNPSFKGVVMTTFEQNNEEKNYGE